MSSGRGRAMGIGLSLPPDYLAGEQSLGRSATQWRDAFGHAGACLEEMRCAGIGSIELRSVSRTAGPGLALRAAQRVWDAGMDLTLHGYLPKGDLGATLVELYPSLAPLAEVLRERRYESIMTLHGYSAEGGDARELAQNTVRALRHVLAVLRDEDVALRIALEINHVTVRSDPTTTYAGIADILSRTDSGQVGACWDMGHAYMNVQEGVLDRVPGATFLRRVVHTHVHDLGPRTHCPLTHGVVPVELFFDLLRDHDYPGVLNLELSPERFRGPVRRLVWASIERVVEYGQGQGGQGRAPGFGAGCHGSRGEEEVP